MKRLPVSPCSACLLTAAGLAVVALVLFIMVSQFAFNIIRDSFLAFLGMVGALPNAAVIAFGIALFVGLAWLFRRWREAQRWRDLGVIREEYEPLVRLLRRRGMHTYLGQIEAIREKIFLERDKIMELRLLLDDELPKIESRITELSNQLGRPGEEDEKLEVRNLMRELIGNGSRLRERKGELERFQKSTVRLASKLNCLRLKLIQEPKEETSIGEIMQTINSISLTEDIWSRDPQRDTDALGADSQNTRPVPVPPRIPE